MKWSPKQARAIDAIARWIADPGDQQTFYLTGHAGTGKSEILRHIAAGVKGPVMFGAYTGRAASVMERKGCRGAQTIHSMIYVPMGGVPPTQEDARKLRDQIRLYRSMKEPATAQHVADSLERQLKRVEEDLDRGAGPRFALNPGAELARAKLCIVDECSFLDRRMGEDLESFGVPILYVGDPAQLPPVFGEGFLASRKADAHLDEIHRQALDSPVLYLADLARRGEPLPYGKHGSSEVLRAGDASLAERALAADMVIVGRNRTRHASNHKIRRLRGLGVTPEVGERAICLRNDHMVGLLNGTQWRIERCLADLDRMSASIKVTPVDEGHSVECDTWLHHFFAREEELVNVQDRRTKQEFDYGYAITCHKSQGGQWNNVMVFDESQSFKRDAHRWRYTALTRAADRVEVVQ